MAPSWIRFMQLEVAGLVAALRAGDDGQALLLGELRGGDDRADADRVDGHRLLHEDVLSRLDDRLEVERPETGRRGQDDRFTSGKAASLR